MIALPVENAGSGPEVLWCRWLPPAITVKRQAIETTGSWSLAGPKDPLALSGKIVQPGAPKPADGNEGDAANEDSKATAGQKHKTAANSEQQGKRRNAEQRAVPAGLKLHATDKAGNCLFEAFAVGFARATKKPAPAHHLQLRAELVQHYVKHLNTYEAQWDKEMPDGSVGDKFETYIEAIAQHKTWGGLLELRALARMFDTKIVVAPRALTARVFARLKAAQKERLVVLLFSGNRYDCLLPEDGKAFSKEIRDTFVEPPSVPMRGGGGSRCSVWATSASQALQVPPASSLPIDAVSFRSDQSPSRRTVWTATSTHSKRTAHAAFPVRKAPLAPSSKCSVWNAAASVQGLQTQRSKPRSSASRSGKVPQPATQPSSRTV